MLITIYLLIGFGLALFISWLGWRSALFHLVAPLYGAIGAIGFHSLGILKTSAVGNAVVMSVVFYAITWLFWLDKNYNIK
jgi:hypothetical protein